MSSDLLPQDFMCDIGLEVHIQLNTASKAFCRDKNLFGSKANQHISEISLAYPGTLPRVNRNHLISAIKLGKALNCQISEESFFDRKNYFYPDLTKGYQITQDGTPICIGGEFSYYLQKNKHTIRIHHIHCEEDAGKSIHDQHATLSLLDYNRAGTPLLELVTEPDFHSPSEVHDFIDALQRLVRYLGISDANMEEGSLRCDCNISIRPKSQIELGQRVEVKNINSKKFAKQAIEFELKRQYQLISESKPIHQETRLYNSKSGATFSMRAKEEANDYRYFPDPDLQMIVLDEKFINNIQESVDTTPWEAQNDLLKNYKLNFEQSNQIVAEKSYYLYFKENASLFTDHSQYANFLINTILPFCTAKSSSIFDYPIGAKKINHIFELISQKKISRSSALQELLPAIYNSPEKDLELLINELGIMVNEGAMDLDQVATEILNAFPDKVKAYRNGKKGLIGFFMGQAMKNYKGSFLPDELKPVLEKHLAS